MGNSEKVSHSCTMTNGFEYLSMSNIQVAREMTVVLGSELASHSSHSQRGNSKFLIEFSGNIGRNGFLTSIASQKNFWPCFQKSRLEYYLLVPLLLFESLLWTFEVQCFGSPTLFDS